MQKEWQKFDREREALYQKAEEKAQKAVKKAREEAEEIVTSIREMKNQASMKEHEWIEARQRFDQLEPNLNDRQKEQTAPKQNQRKQELEVGDEVRLLTLNQAGTVIAIEGKNTLQVQVGVMKMKVKKQDVQLMKKEDPIVEKPLATVKGAAYHVKTELDLRGERYEDALMELEKYIDDVTLAGYPQVTIIHGKGTGALRKGVQAFGDRHRNIKSARVGGMNEGGSGVTIFELS